MRTAVLLLVAESASSLTALVLIALLSGAGGALFSTFWQTRHEREERMRERMIVAAHDLATGAAQASIPLRAFISADRGNPSEMTRARQALKELRRLTDEAAAREPLVLLLFGQDSATAKAGSFMVDEIRGALLEAERVFPEVGDAEVYEGQAAEQFGKFIGAVHDRIAAPRWRLRRPEHP